HPKGPDLQVSGHNLEKALGRVVETRDLGKGVVVGVPAAPVVTLASDPVPHVDGLAVDGELALVDGQRRGDEVLRLREAALVKTARQEKERRLIARVAEFPRERIAEAGARPF